MDKVISLLRASDDETVQTVIDSKKFQRYFKGLIVIGKLLSKTIRKLEIAEMIEDDDFIMDLEALKSEASTLMEELTSKIDTLVSFDSSSFLSRLRTELKRQDDLSVFDSEDMSALLLTMKSSESRSQEAVSNVCE